MSMKVDVTISFEELRALSNMIDIAGLSLKDKVGRDVQAYEHDLSSQVIAGIKSVMLQKISAMPKGDHLRDMYWSEVSLLTDENLDGPLPSLEEVEAFRKRRAKGAPMRPSYDSLI